MNIIITMAGLGTRVSEYSKLPKHMLIVNNKTLFEHSVSSLKYFFDETFYFITLKKNNDTDFIINSSKKLGIKKFNIIVLNKPTKGQAHSVIKANKYIADIKSILIHNIDTHINPDKIKLTDIKGDGWIPCFPSTRNHWSFVKFDNNLKVTDVTEKVRISKYASPGLYYFKSIKLFKECYETYYNNTNNKEEYIMPIYKIMLQNNNDIFTKILDKNDIYCLGTPNEIKEYEENLEK